jgi:hypothetical protein
MTLSKSGSMNLPSELRYLKQLGGVFQHIAFVVVELSTGLCLRRWARGGHCVQCGGGVVGRTENKCVYLGHQQIIAWPKGNCFFSQRDTLLRYLLDELHSYEDDYSDALCPIQREADVSLLGEHRLVAPASTEEMRMMHTALTSDIKAVQTNVSDMSVALVQLTRLIHPPTKQAQGAYGDPSATTLFFLLFFLFLFVNEAVE